MEELLSLSPLDIGLNVESVEQFGCGFVVQIIKSPIRLWIEFAYTCPFLNGGQPISMLGVYRICIERNQYPSSVTVYDDLEATVAPRLPVNRLAETHFVLWILLAGLSM